MRYLVDSLDDMAGSTSVVIVEVRGTLGSRHDDIKSITVSSRVICWVATEKPECIERNAASRRREELVVQLWLSATRGATTPLEKVGVDDSTMVLLEDSAAETFRRTFDL